LSSQNWLRDVSFANAPTTTTFGSANDACASARNSSIEPASRTTIVRTPFASTVAAS